MSNKCFACDEESSNLQNAHIIGNRKVNRKVYGYLVIDSPLNVLLACDLHCNSLIDLGFHELLKERVASIIESVDLSRDEKRAEIETIVRENIKRKKGKV